MSKKGYKQTEEHKRKISLSHKGWIFSPKHIKNLSESHKGFIPTIETRKKLSEALKGKDPVNRKNLYTPELNKQRSQKLMGRKMTDQDKLKMSQGSRGKPKLNMRGINHHNYKGGVTPIHNQIRGSIEYKIWSHSVMCKDNFTCQKTGQRGGKLVAHHILNFSSHPEIRFAIDNGITLSLESHKEFHKIYGKTNNNREQLEEFLNK